MILETRSPTSALILLLAAVFLAGGLAGCSAVGPDYAPPDIQPPSDYTAALERELVGGELDLGPWWRRLDDPVLDGLVARAVENNLDLRAALARIQAARALRGITRTGFWPTVDATAAYTRSQFSEETVNGAFLPRTADLYAVGAEAQWELDLWGRVRRQIEAADAELAVAIEDARDVLITVVAETALAYVDLRNFQQRAQLARTNIDLQGQTLELTENQFRANLVSQLDVAQARSSLEGTRSNLPPFEAEARAARNRLAVLLGLFPGELEDELATYSDLPMPPEAITVGLPADVLRRRPDVRSAERRLAAQTARVGVATAELYPLLQLGGSIGYEAQEGGDLFGDSATAFGFGPSVRWNLFDRRRLRDAIRVEDAGLGQALAAYELTLLRALEEVETLMTRFVNRQASRDALVSAVSEGARAVELSKDQYRQGIVSFQSVLDSQRRLFELQDSLAVTEAAITTDLILLYRALGGGWESLPLVLDRTDAEAPPTGQ